MDLHKLVAAFVFFLVFLPCTSVGIGNNPSQSVFSEFMKSGDDDPQFISQLPFISEPMPSLQPRSQQDNSEAAECMKTHGCYWFNGRCECPAEPARQDESLCLPDGSYCTLDSSCCSGWCPSYHCKSKEEPSCLPDGSSCLLDSQCCPGSACQSYKCTSQTEPEPSCLPDGSSCLLDSQCCNGWCKSWQCINPNEPQPPSCLPEGSSCSLDSQCCSGVCHSWQCTSKEIPGPSKISTIWVGDVYSKNLPGAEVFVDGSSRGITDSKGEIRTSVNFGQHTLSARADCGEASKKYDFTSDINGVTLIIDSCPGGGTPTTIYGWVVIRGQVVSQPVGDIYSQENYIDIRIDEVLEYPSFFRPHSGVNIRVYSTSYAMISDFLVGQCVEVRGELMTSGNRGMLSVDGNKGGYAKLIPCSYQPIPPLPPAPPEQCDQQACHAQSRPVGQPFASGGKTYQRYMECNCVNGNCSCRYNDQEIPQPKQCDQQACQAQNQPIGEPYFDKCGNKIQAYSICECKGFDCDCSGREEVVVETRKNRPPDEPSILGPKGKASNQAGYKRVSYLFSSSTKDSDGDMITYRFIWDDGQKTDVGPIYSGQSVTASHSWDGTRIYQVRVMAIDQCGAESKESCIIYMNII